MCKYVLISHQAEHPYHASFEAIIVYVMQNFLNTKIIQFVIHFFEFVQIIIKDLLYSPKFLEKDWAANISKPWSTKYLIEAASWSTSPEEKPW